MGDTNTAEVDIPLGTHEFKFAHYLPATCPSSFEGFYGSIYYKVQVELIRPWKFNQCFSKGFTVIKLMDLNYQGAAMSSPISAEMQKKFFMSSEPLKMSANLPQAGYVPGQLIPIDLLVSNETSTLIKGIKIKLSILVCYRAPPSIKTKEERIVVSKVTGESVLRHCNKLFHYELPVPATPPSCYDMCKLIQIGYQVEICAKMQGFFYADQVLCVPVTIGCVPLMQNMLELPTCSKADVNEINNGAQAKKAEAEASKSNETIELPAPWAFYANLSPPTYAEATHTSKIQICAPKKEDTDYGETYYKPRYAVFDLQNVKMAEKEDQKI